MGMTEAGKTPRRWRVHLPWFDAPYYDADALLKVLHPVDGGREFMEKVEAFRAKVLKAAEDVPPEAVVDGAVKEYVMRRFCEEAVNGEAAPADRRSERRFRDWRIVCEVRLKRAAVWRIGTTPERALAFDAKTVRRLVYPLFPLSVREEYLEKTRGLASGREAAQVICRLMDRYKVYYRGGREMGANLTEWRSYCQALYASREP